MAVRRLHDGVPPLQGRQRRERPDPGQPVVEVVGGAVEAVSDGTTAALDQPVTCSGSWSNIRCGSASTGRERMRVQAVLLALDQAAAGRSDRGRASATTFVRLLGDVGHDALGRVGRGRRSQVGDQVEQRLVLLVPDRADDRGATGGDRAHQAFVGERQQVLERTAARATR